MAVKRQRQSGGQEKRFKGSFHQSSRKNQKDRGLTLFCQVMDAGYGSLVVMKHFDPEFPMTRTNPYQDWLGVETGRIINCIDNNYNYQYIQ